MKLQCLCMLVVVAVTSGMKRFAPYHPHWGSELNGELYDPSTQKCCRGVAHPKAQGTFILCCGNTTYDITENICCQGTSLPLSAGTRTACCGSMTYDVKSALCCMGRVAKLPKHCSEEDIKYFECRRSKAVDTRNTTENELEPPPSYSGFRVSGGYGSYPRPYLPFPDQGYNNICDGKKFNTTTHMCCNNTLKESSIPNAKCCGEDQGYNDKKQVCCKSPEGDWKLSPKPTSSNPDNIHYYGYNFPSCCAGVAYDRTSELCCQEKLHKLPGLRWEYQCCGSEVIETATHSCCDGVTAVEKKTDSEGCCGNNTFSYRSQLCCYHKEETKVYDKVENQRSQCCAGEIYNTKTHLCCYDYRSIDGNYENLIEKATPTSQCCGNSSYDSTKEICCGTTVSTLESGTTRMQCCGDEVYNPDTQMCCDQKVLDIEDDSKRSCCSVYASDDYMTGCFGMNRPHQPYYDPPMYAFGKDGGPSSGSEEDPKEETATSSGVEETTQEAEA